MTSFRVQIDVSEHAESVAGLYEYCTEQDIETLFVLAPTKIEESDVYSGTLDFANQNADDLISYLQEYQITTLDLRNLIEEQGLSHKELFFKTDPHWKPEAGLWGAKQIAEYLNDNCGCDIDISMLDADQYRSVVYEDWYLGAQGKKATLVNCEAEGFTMLYPLFQTEIEYTIPNLGIETTGDFSVTYDMDEVEVRDLYEKDCYTAYNHSNQPLITIKNSLNTKEDGVKILIVKDSFANVVIPFLGVTDGVDQIDSIDLRLFDGSLETYIEETEPDVVLILYNPGSISETIDWSSHTDLYDFR